MKVNEIAARLNGMVHCHTDTDITRFYSGDFLSRVIGRAPAHCGWLTVMTHLNVAGVAVLGEIAAVIICEGLPPSPELKEKLTDEGIALITTPLDAFSAATALSK